jgi:hypothetical protein
MGTSHIMENQNDNETQAACGVDSSDLMDDLLWRLKDIREDLMSTGLGGRLASAIRVIEKFKTNQQLSRAHTL